VESKVDRVAIWVKNVLYIIIILHLIKKNFMKQRSSWEVSQEISCMFLKPKSCSQKAVVSPCSDAGKPNPWPPILLLSRPQFLLSIPRSSNWASPFRVLSRPVRLFLFPSKRVGCHLKQLITILCVLDRASSWYLNKGRPTWWYLLYYVNLLLNKFQMLIHPSSGACDYLVRYCVGCNDRGFCVNLFI